MLSRREFMSTGVRGSTLIALCPVCLASWPRRARAAVPVAEGRILVVVQLDGGNDGINTLVPFKDEGYAKHRKVLRVPTHDLIQASTTGSADTRRWAAADTLLDAGGWR